MEPKIRRIIKIAAVILNTVLSASFVINVLAGNLPRRSDAAIILLILFVVIMSMMNLTTLLFKKSYERIFYLWAITLTLNAVCVISIFIYSFTVLFGAVLQVFAQSMINFTIVIILLAINIFTLLSIQEKYRESGATSFVIIIGLHGFIIDLAILRNLVGFEAMFVGIFLTPVTYWVTPLYLIFKWGILNPFSWIPILLCYGAVVCGVIANRLYPEAPPF